MMDWNGMPLTFTSIYAYTGPEFLEIFLCIVNIILIVLLFKEFNVHGTKTKKSLVELCNCCGGGNEESEKRK